MESVSVPVRRSFPRFRPINGFGTSVAALGDVDGDGTGDFAVGAPGSGSPRLWDSRWGKPYLGRGTAWIFSGADRHILHVREGVGPNDRLGASVEAAGDVDNDGRADVLIGVPGEPGELGCVLLYSGAEGRLLRVLRSDRKGDGFGRVIRSSQRVQPGAFEWIAVGAPDDDRGGAGAGALWLFSGDGRRRLWVREGRGAGARFGSSIEALPDLDGDLWPDLASGAPEGTLSSGAGRSGYVEVLSRAKGRVLVTLSGSETGDRFGDSVACLLSSDSSLGTRLAIGSPASETSSCRMGSVQIYSCMDWSLLRTSKRHDRSRACEDRSDWDKQSYGANVTSTGDLDRDGLDDLLVGVPEGFWMGGFFGWAEVVSGRTGDSIQIFTWDGRRTSRLGSMGFGASLCNVGDLDGDGVPDLAFGVHDGGGPGELQISCGATGELLDEMHGDRMSERRADSKDGGSEQARER